MRSSLFLRLHAELARRPSLSLLQLAPFMPELEQEQIDILNETESAIKYAGYIKRQKQQVAQFKKLESKRLDPDFDYSEVPSLRREAVQKLNLYKPMNIGQASRISGVSPADISVLLIYLEQLRHQRK